MFRLVERITFLSIIAALLATNVLTVTNAAFHEKLFDLFSSLPIPYSQFPNNSLIHKQRSSARKVSKRIANRTVRTVTRNVGSVVPEAIPYLGVGVMLSVTAMDVIDGCATMRDVHELLQTFNVKGVDEQLNEVCSMVVPGQDSVMSGVEQQLEARKEVAEADDNDSYRKFYDALGGKIYEMFH